MKFYVHKLGCPKNDVDADYISARLIHDGHEPVTDPKDADSIIVNTCGFILPAKEESINEMLRLSQLKKEGKLKTLYAAGCLSQRHGDELLKEMHELDGAFGLGALDSISQAVTSSITYNQSIKMEPRQLGYLSWNNRYIADNFPFAYLKISDGCNRRCSYCAIPSIRGKYRSRSLESILREAEFLAQNGKKELILVSQEASLYGTNYQGDGHPDIIILLKELEKIDSVEWIRLMYLYPTQLDDDIIDYMSNGYKTLNYFDLPLQHINSKILSAMRRPTERSFIEKQIKKIREKSPDAAIRTTFIVGFPGETDEQFHELEEFIIENEFDRLGVFAYSQEEGTPAAQLENQIPNELIIERMDRLMTIQQEIVFRNNNTLIGKLRDVIIDVVSGDGSARGRTQADCPDVDQEVFICGDNLNIGDIRKVKIVAAEGYDLKGTIVKG